jgi:ligand-binding sensor domain-containing protein
MKNYFFKWEKYKVGTIKLFFASIILLTDLILAQQYNFVHYNRSEDKIGNQVWDIFQDSKGYMWFATSAGVSRYNGWKYNVYTKEQGLLESFAFNVKEDEKGNFWIGSPWGVSKISFDKKKSSSPEVRNYSLGKFMDFYRVYIDGYNRIWVYNTVTPSDIYIIENDSLINFSEKYRFHEQ